MKTLDLSGLISTPACVVEGEKISAVLDTGSEFGITDILLKNFEDLNKSDAETIAGWLVYHSGKSDTSLQTEAKFTFGHCNVTIRKAVTLAWQTIASIELTGNF